mgnify:CR=1 FL=1|tara:strand:- start:41 stop:685 length:645 start_codon:yes stop_codon:yes gene_type:complete
MDGNLNLGYNSIYPNYGWYIDRVPQNVLNELGQQVNNLQSNFSKGEKLNDKLAGEIEHEYLIKTQYQTKQYIKDLSQQFENESQYMVLNHNPLPTLKFEYYWVNFQKKHEYNPIHCHTGVYSFVIWYQVPYTFENELKYTHKSNYEHCTHGRFTFVIPTHSSFPDPNLQTQVLDIDKSKEGYIAIFPSSLNHTVYPFYSSDDYRITIAGNITIS